MISIRDICFVSLGALFAASPFVTSQSSNPSTSQVDFLSKVMDQTITSYQRAQDHNERELFALIPNTLRCEDLSWLEKCDDLNTYYKRHPTANIRLKDKWGYDHSFIAGTPNTMISLQMNPSKETAFNHLHQRDHEDKFVKAAHRFGAEALFSKKASSLSTTGTANLALPVNELSVQALVSSEEDYSPLVHQLQALHKKHPDLNISIHLADGSSRNFVNDMTKKGFKASIISSTQQSEFKKKNSSIPAIWINHTGINGEKSRNIITRSFTAESLERAAFALTRKNT